MKYNREIDNLRYEYSIEDDGDEFHLTITNTTNKHYTPTFVAAIGILPSVEQTIKRIQSYLRSSKFFKKNAKILADDIYDNWIREGGKR